MKQINNKASILIAMTVLYVLIALSVGFVILNTMEMSLARRHYHSTSAFWLAEAGVSMFLNDSKMLNDSFSQTISYGNGVITLTRDDSHPTHRYIISTGTVGKMQRKIQLGYVANVPEAYRNTLSTKGDITVTGKKVSLVVNDKIRASGRINNHSSYGHMFLEDAQPNQDASLTSLTYPNLDPGNPDEFKNFVDNNRDILKNYSKDEVLHIKTDGTFTLPSDGSLSGKKIIYIEGDVNGGNVVIDSNNVVTKGQNLTIIATGNVTFNQNGFQPPNSQLNIISWGGYNETVSAPSSYQGLIYTHGSASFDRIIASSTNSGSLVADGGIVFGEVWSTKMFNYMDMVKHESYPPGFERLGGGSISGVAPYPSSWKEIL
jgi:hypothetical protein